MHDAVTSSTGKQARDARGHIGVATLLSVAAVVAGAADATTGRNMALAAHTVAERARVGERTAQRAMYVLEDLGYCKTVEGGRYLTHEERADARRMHGAKQLRAASTRALTVPGRKPISVDIGDLPPVGESSFLSHLLRNSPKRASARKKAATRPHRRKKQAHHRKPWPLAVQKTAAQLIARLPWLQRGIHHGSVCRTLTLCGIDCDQWNGNDVLDVLDAWSLQHHRTSLAGGEVRSPLAWLATLLRRSTAAAAELHWKTRAQRRAEHEAEKAEYAARRAIERREEEQRRAQIEADRPKIDKIIAEMRAQLRETDARQRRTLGRTRTPLPTSQPCVAR